MWIVARTMLTSEITIHDKMSEVNVIIQVTIQVVAIY